MSTTAMKSALDAHKHVEDFATTKAKPSMRYVDEIQVEQFIRQGDVYLVRIKELGKGYDKVTSDRQLAPGTTKGSRHIIAANPAVTIYAAPGTGNFLMGPQIDAKERFVLEHPEHAHFSLPPGLYQARYQQEWTERDEVRRVRD